MIKNQLRVEKKILGIFRINPASINPSRTTPVHPSNPFEVEEDRPGDFSSSRRMRLDEASKRPPRREGWIKITKPSDDYH